ncbi:MAG: sulfurtransferase TusA family protein [Gammaproteobacteria bacterium]|jgi:tRNA 2-thiouridine synthesizing protein A
MSAVAERLDARGMNCPLPILKTRKALNQLNAGELLEVTASDPGSVKDMDAFCTQTGNRLVSSAEAENSYVFLIEKS